MQISAMKPLSITFLPPQPVIVPTSRWTMRDGQWVKIPTYRVTEPDDRVRYMDELPSDEIDVMARAAVEMGEAVTAAGF